MCRLVTSPARPCNVFGARVSIVTRGARQLAAAPQKTSRANQAIARIVDRNPIVRFRFYEIEVQHEIAQRLSGPEREWAAAEAADRIGKRPAGGFQMALQANLELAVGAQLRGIYDAALTFYMCFAGPMATLAIDAAGEPAVRFRWVSVVAEETGIGNYAAKIGVVRTIVSRAHRPLPAALGIPAQRKLDKLASLIAVQECLRVIA